MKLSSILARGLFCPLFAVVVLSAAAFPDLPLEVQMEVKPQGAGNITPAPAVIAPGTTTTFTAIPNPGYAFSSWVYESLPDPTAVSIDGNTARVTNTPSLTNVRLEADFRPGAYTITFDPNEGTLVGDSSMVVTNEIVKTTGYPKFPTVTREGYRFDGWMTNEVAWAVKEGDRIWLTGDVVAKAKWAANEYTITYKANDDTTRQREDRIVFGGNYNPPTDIKRSGYELAGWWLDPVDEASPIDSMTPMLIPSNHNVYAHWTAGRYRVDFNPGEGAVVSPTSKENIAYGSPYGELPTPTREGFEFTGWYTSGGTLVTAETKVTTAAIHTLYARWSGKSYAITKNISDDCTLTVAETGRFGEPLSLEWTKGTKIGYTETNTTLVITATDGAVLAAHTNRTSASYTMTGKYYSPITISVSSLFKPNTYRVSFAPQGGSSVSSKVVTYDSTYGELPTPMRTGYDFGGWFTAEDGGDEVTKATWVKITAEQTLYAHWTAKTYTVTPKTDGHCSLTVAPTGTFDQPLPVGWSAEVVVGYSTQIKSVTLAADETGSGKVLATYTMGSGADFTMENSYYSGIVITATAEQRANSYTVKFDANGARGKMDSISCTYDKAFDLPKQNSYTNLTAKFLGWSLDPKAAKPEWDDEAKGIKNLATDDGATVTLYAVWQDLQNELTRAAHGKNVILNTSGTYPFMAYTNEVGRTSARSGQFDRPPNSCAMSVTVNGPGTFSFVWKAAGETDNFMAAIDGTGPDLMSEWGGVDAGEGWKRIESKFESAGDHEIIWYSVADDPTVDYLLVDQVEWKPAGWVDEPTEADRRDISAVTMENGELAVSFGNSDSRFAYSLHGTNDLTAARALWPVILTTNGTDEAITIKPEVRADEKKFFYYLEVHSK